MRDFRIVLQVAALLAIAMASQLAAADKEPSPAEIQQRLRRVAEVVHARKMLREHAAGKIALSEAEVKRFQELARHTQTTPKEAPSAPARLPVVMRMRDADLETVAGAIKIYSGKPVILAPDLPRRPISIKLEARSATEMLPLLEDVLNRAGYRTVPIDGGLRLEAIALPGENPAPK